MLDVSAVKRVIGKRLARGAKPANIIRWLTSLKSKAWKYNTSPIDALISKFK